MGGIELVDYDDTGDFQPHHVVTKPLTENCPIAVALLDGRLGLALLARSYSAARDRLAAFVRQRTFATSSQH